MTELFYTILNMSISASILILAVLLLRLIFRKAPKWVTVLLWGLVALRLVMPFSVESPLSLIPKTDWVVSESSPSVTAPPANNTGSSDVPGDAINIPDTPGSPIQSAPITPITPITPSENSPTQSAPTTPITPITPEPTPTAPVEENISLTEVIPYVWLCGVAAMLIYMVLSYLSVKQKVKVKSPLRDNIYLSNTASPFVLGIVKPKIYLPADMDEATTSYVIAHEETHIRRRDHWWKPLGFILLAVHWFNPLLWLSYILLCRDIEMACDERVIRDMGTAERANYSEALLLCSINRSPRDPAQIGRKNADSARVGFSACPLAFGEVGVKERIKSVLSYKKPAFWIVLVAVLACIVTAVCFLTNPMGSEQYNEESSYFVMIEEDGISEILVSTPDSSGGCINADNSTFKKGKKIYLEHLNGVVDLRGIEVAALNEAGDTVYSVQFPENTTNEEIKELLESTTWFIPPTEVLEKYATPDETDSEKIIASNISGETLSYEILKQHEEEIWEYRTTATRDTVDETFRKWGERIAAVSVDQSMNCVVVYVYDFDRGDIGRFEKALGHLSYILVDKNSASLADELPELLERMYLYEGYYNEAVGITVDHNDRAEDTRYCKVTDERFDTVDEWIAFAETVFTGEELDREKNALAEYVIEIDGCAYIIGRVVPVWNFDTNTYSIIEENDTSATVELLRTRVAVGDNLVETYKWTLALTHTDAGWRIARISVEESEPIIPKSWQTIEYEGTTYDLSAVNDKIFRVGEPERIGKHILAKCALTSGDTVYVVINTSTHQIEHSFEGERIAYHSHDVNSIVYSSENKIYRYDGSVIYEHDDPSEFINAIEYREGNLKLIITLQGSTRSRTVSVDLSNPTEGHIFEYGGISYDLSSETDSHIQGVYEYARIGKHVVAYGDPVGKNGGIFFVINTETHEIENHFSGSILTYYGDDVNTIVYSMLGKIYSYDGNLIAAPEKGYISAMKYVSNFIQLEVTFHTGETVIVDLPPEPPIVTHLSEFIIGMQSAEIVSRPDVALIDEATVQESEYPVYYNRFASDHAGPMYETTDEYIEKNTKNLQDFLFILYGENVSASEFSTPSYAGCLVQYTRGDVEFSSNADRITVSFPKSKMDAEITAESAKTNVLLVAAMEYLGIDEPILKTTLDYNLENEPSWYSHIFSESTTDHSEYLWNTTFNYAEIWGGADLDSWHLSITKYDSPKIHSTPEIIPYSAAVEYIKTNFPTVDTSELTAEIYYARLTGTDCFIPCYRFYFPSDTPNITTYEIPEFCEYYIDIPMISADLVYPKK